MKTTILYSAVFICIRVCVLRQLTKLFFCDFIIVNQRGKYKIPLRTDGRIVSIVYYYDFYFLIFTIVFTFKKLMSRSGFMFRLDIHTF